MTTLIESNAKPYGSSKGTALSLLIHGVVIGGLLYGTSQVMLPPREKIEQHTVLYVATPPPPPVQVAPKPLPKIKEPPKTAPARKQQFVQARPVPPQPRPNVPATPVLTAPVKVSVTIPDIDLKAAIPSIEAVEPPASEPLKSSGSAGGAQKTSNGDVGQGKGGLGSGSAGKAYDENQVERAVEITRPAIARYPETLRSVGVQGSVVMRFIVGTDGKVEPGSFEVISSPHKLFSDAVRASLLLTRYRPAEAGGHTVRQLVEQAFSFKLN